MSETAPSPATSAAGYVVGVDAGGTKLHLRAAEPSGRLIADVVRPAEQWTALSIPDKAAALVFQLANSPFPEPVALGIGAHGCDSDTECAELQAAVQALVSCPVRVVNDAVLLGQAAGRSKTANLVIGTGSIAVAGRPDGSTLYAGGWGWLLGDPGSAWGIVRDAVNRLTQAHDAGRTDDLLLMSLQAQTGLETLRAISDRMQTQPAQSWAAWAPAVFNAADRGSPAASAALSDAADRIVGLIDALIARGAEIKIVVAGGGVIINQIRLQNELQRRLSERLGLDLIVLREDPVAGAVLLANSLVTGQG